MGSVRRENNGGVENGDVSMFVDMRWQTQRGGKKSGMIETILPHRRFCKCPQGGRIPLIGNEGDARG
jgi:hypothetical protein